MRFLIKIVDFDLATNRSLLNDKFGYAYNVYLFYIYLRLQT